ncbi:NADH-quinone oxidoreductase subunit N [Terracoccus luteus]|uniref:NADH dehydrogenase subunit N n=1 Tax=Terracoccus luteus TaxID=53356 RepID=A0A495Y0A6_9MICO|nr:proton-conducting transporter membrane subunit [Terracoccus luteus]MBB2986082.1 NADH-quinone oxidoreductase subunit N [Terracoccus luteus]MCP2171734.1 NADH-quinone oxidoreductase subunit N [Terracoccus luteus]RKT78845.1 NADH dehydrogenase subunit N [Terracoccus luteus]
MTGGLVIDVGALWPALFPLLGVVAVLVADLVSPRLRETPFVIAAVAAGFGAWTCLPGVLQTSGEVRTSFCLPSGWTVPAASGSGEAVGAAAAAGNCLWQADSLSSALQLAANLSALVVLLLAWPGRRARATDPGTTALSTPSPTSEPVQAVLLLAALSGTVVVAAARDIATWLVALELATLPVIALVALSGGRRAVAGAVQLLVTSLVSFALLALGAALWFAATGSPFLSGAAALGAQGAGVATGGVANAALLSLSVVLVVAGLGFKLSLVPFHAWTPTAYSGSSLPVAAFLATVSKIGALAGLLVFLRAVAALGTPGLVVVAVVAALSMTLGNVMALRQDDVVLLLAWSTVAQAGWVVLPLVSVSALGTSASATYLLTYVVATLVAFAVVALRAREVGVAARRLDAYEGLWRRTAWRAGALGLALTSLAGLPPGIVGLVGKVVALRPVVAEGWTWLTVVAAANAVLGVAVYLRWLRPVVTSVDTPDAGRSAPTVAVASRWGGPGRRGPLVAALVLTVAVLFVVSVQPDLLFGLLG